MRAVAHPPTPARRQARAMLAAQAAQRSATRQICRRPAAPTAHPSRASSTTVVMRLRSLEKDAWHSTERLARTACMSQPSRRPSRSSATSVRLPAPCSAPAGGCARAGGRWGVGGGAAAGCTDSRAAGQLGSAPLDSLRTTASTLGKKKARQGEESRTEEQGRAGRRSRAGEEGEGLARRRLAHRRSR